MRKLTKYGLKKNWQEEMSYNELQNVLRYNKKIYTSTRKKIEIHLRREEKEIQNCMNKILNSAWLKIVLTEMKREHLTENIYINGEKKITPKYSCLDIVKTWLKIVKQLSDVKDPNTYENFIVYLQGEENDTRI